MDTLPEVKSDDIVAFNERPPTYYEWKPERVIMAPFVPPIATEQQTTEDLKIKLEKSQQDFDDYKKTMEARFDKLADFLAKSLQKTS